MTETQKKISRRNHDRVAKELNLPKGCVLHHIDDSWKENDIDRYILWNAEDLVIMTKAEHCALHMTGRHHSEDTKQHLREINLGNNYNGRNFLGKHHTEETKKHLSDVLTGHEVTDETKEKLKQSRLGRHWYNNGVIHIQAYECPEGFVEGRMFRKNKSA